MDMLEIPKIVWFCNVNLVFACEVISNVENCH